MELELLQRRLETAGEAETQQLAKELLSLKRTTVDNINELLPQLEHLKALIGAYGIEQEQINEILKRIG